MGKLNKFLAVMAVVLLASAVALLYYRKDIGKYQISGEGYVLNTTTGELSYRLREGGIQKTNMNTGATKYIK